MVKWHHPGNGICDINGRNNINNGGYQQ